MRPREKYKWPKLIKNVENFIKNLQQSKVHHKNLDEACVITEMLNRRNRFNF